MNKNKRIQKLVEEAAVIHHKKKNGKKISPKEENSILHTILADIWDIVAGN